MATILREIIKGTINFNYQVREITIPERGPIKSQIKEINCGKTEMRRLQYGLGFEKLVNGVPFIISETDFLFECSKVRNPQVKVRKATSGEVRTNPIPELNLMDRIGLTTHCKERMEERFQVFGPAQRPYLEKHLQDHFIVQNFHLYNSNFTEGHGRAHDLAVCSRDYRHVWIMSLDKNRKLSVLTCYNPYDSEFGAFDKWFNDHMHEIHEMPTLQDYLAA